MIKSIGILSLALLLLSCQNKSKLEYEPTLTETQSEESYQQPDTAVIEDVKGQREDVKVMMEEGRWKKEEGRRKRNVNR